MLQSQPCGPLTNTREPTRVLQSILHFSAPAALLGGEHVSASPARHKQGQRGKVRQILRVAKGRNGPFWPGSSTYIVEIIDLTHRVPGSHLPSIASAKSIPALRAFGLPFRA